MEEGKDIASIKGTLDELSGAYAGLLNRAVAMYVTMSKLQKEVAKYERRFNNGG